MSRLSSRWRHLPRPALLAARLLTRAVLSVITVLAVAAPAPARGATCGALNPWFQPHTVQRGDPLLVTGTGVPANRALLFEFIKIGSTSPDMRYITGSGNSKCVVNQEYVDTFHFGKGGYETRASSLVVENLNPSQTGFTHYDLQYTLELGSDLSIVARTTPMPVPTPANCGQPAHAWFGPSTVPSQQQMYFAAVAYPGTYVYFFFDDQNGNLVTAVRLDSAHSNCVADQQFFYFLLVGTFDVHAAYWDESGHYNYVDIGTLRVVP